MENPAEVFKPPGQDDDFVFKYLDTLRSNISQAEQGISRQLVLITILSAIFLLLAENQVGGISLARSPCRIFVISEPDRGDVSIAPYLLVLCSPHVRRLRRLLAFNGLLVRF
jgi:hypothetical protein